MSRSSSLATPIARIACAQLSPVIGDPEGNRRRILDAVDRLVPDQADLLVLPELATSGYLLADRDEVAAAAIGADDPLFAQIAHSLPERAVVVLGFAERAGGALYNSAAVVDATGLRAVYRKTHLWDRETLLFTPGVEAAPVVDTALGRVGVLICYDLEFSEMPRALAVAGADLIAVPTNWPLVERPASERAPEVIAAQAAARSNGVFIAACDRDGVERGQEWTRGTVIIDQFGWVMDAAGEGDVARADVFLHLARDKAISPYNDLLADRRPDIYRQENPVR